MPDQFPVLKTKLYRPPVSKDLVYRTELLEQLNRHSDLPLTMVSAPAGYGKSLAVSQWIEYTQKNHAWISLDIEHNDLRTFLEYLVEAVKITYPDILGDIIPYLKGKDLPPVKVLAYDLINALDEIKDEFVIVLDDYHSINDSSVHEMMNRILKYPPQSTQLVIISRTDPPLHISQLRAYGRINEFRVKQLCFTKDEIATLYNILYHKALSQGTIEYLYNKTEGWIVGLRLAFLNASEAEDINIALSEVKGDIRFIAHFLLDEVFSKQSQFMHQYLLSSAILKRFNADLVDAINEPNKSDDENGREFIKKLEQTNLFLIPLDHERKWYRYHHLFQELLLNQAKLRFSNKQIRQFHANAAVWFETEKLFDEAINHYLEAGKLIQVASIIEDHSHQVFVKGELARVESWLNKLPASFIEKRSKLLLMTAWSAFGSFQMERIPPIIEKVEKLFIDQSIEPLTEAEIGFFKGNLLYWIGESAESINILQHTLRITSDMPIHVLCNTEMILFLARHRTGEKESLISDIDQNISDADPANGLYISYTYGSLVFVCLLSGLLSEARSEASKMQQVSHHAKANYLHNWSNYFLGFIDFHMGHFGNSVDLFESVYKQRFIIDARAVLDVLSGMALSQELNGQSEKAQKTIQNLLEYANILGDPQSQLIANSAKARIDLQQGRINEAYMWAKDFKEPANFVGLFLWIENPHMTKAKILIAKGSEKNLHKAQLLLMELQDICISSNMNMHQVELTFLLAMVNKKQGYHEKSDELIRESLYLADQNQMWRPFLEMCKVDESLISELKAQVFDHEVINILEKSEIASNNTSREEKISKQNIKNNIHESLSVRETEVLEFVAEGYRNKEIAQKLFVSEVTIKKHLYNIFKKLDVNNRINMVQKAKELEIFSNA